MTAPTITDARVEKGNGYYQVVEGSSVHATYSCGLSHQSSTIAKLRAEAFLNGMRYAALATAPSREPERAGWVLVPEEPTDEMRQIGGEAWWEPEDVSDGEAAAHVYRNMLDATPLPPTADPQGVKLAPGDTHLRRDIARARESVQRWATDPQGAGEAEPAAWTEVDCAPRYVELRDLVSSQIRSTPAPATGEVEELAKRLDSRKAFFLNGAHWMMSNLPDTGCTDAARLLRSQAAEIVRLTAAIEHWRENTRLAHEQREAHAAHRGVAEAQLATLKAENDALREGLRLITRDLGPETPLTPDNGMVTGMWRIGDHRRAAALLSNGEASR